MKKKTLICLLGAGCGLFVTSASGQFFADFETDTTANWNVNVSPGGQGSADFYFDYSTVGVPPAPNSNGTTRGLRLAANWDANVFGGLSVSPIGQSFTGDFVLKFDYWSNFVGPFPNEGSGSTMVSGFGIGTAGTTAQWAGGVHDSLQFGATGDGDSTADYRVYPNGPLAQADSGYYAAGGLNNTEAYYSVFGGVEAPAEQLALYPSQTGTTAIGTAGMAWHEMVITKSGDTVTWHMSGVLIATVENYSSLNVGGDNIFFNRYDFNATSSTTNGDMQFTLIDNISVIPEPSTYAVIFGGFALAGALVYRRRMNRA